MQVCWTVRWLVRQRPQFAQRKAWARSHSPHPGQAVAIATLIRRILVVNNAPNLSRRSRMGVLVTVMQKVPGSVPKLGVLLKICL